MKFSYGNFDGIRGLAAIIVMVFHCSIRADWGAVVPVGYLAVDLFFILSGFVIAQAYADKLLGGMSFREFVAVRARRLYPLIFLGQMLGFLVFLAAALNGVDGYSTAPLLLALVFGLLILPVPVWGVGNTPPIMPLNGPTWSLFAEVAINVAYALALPWLSRRVLWILLGLGAISLAATAFLWGSLHVGWSAGNFIGSGPRVLFSFTAGVLLYEYRPRALIESNMVSVALLAATAVLLSAGTTAWWHDLPVVYLAFPAMVFVASKFQPGRLLEGVFRWLGKVSYPVYILHMPVLYGIATFVAPRVEGAAKLNLVWIGAMIGIVAAADLIDRIYDMPIRRALAGKRPNSDALKADRAASY